MVQFYIENFNIYIYKRFFIVGPKIKLNQIDNSNLIGFDFTVLTLKHVTDSRVPRANSRVCRKPYSSFRYIIFFSSTNDQLHNITFYIAEKWKRREQYVQTRTVKTTSRAIHRYYESTTSRTFNSRAIW